MNSMLISGFVDVLKGMLLMKTWSCFTQKSIESSVCSMPCKICSTATYILAVVYTCLDGCGGSIFMTEGSVDTVFTTI